MTPASALRSVDRKPPPASGHDFALEELELLLAASDDPAEIAAGVLKAALSVTGNAAGAILLPLPDAAEVLAAMGIPGLVPGTRIPDPGSIPRGRGTLEAPLRSGGRTFGELVLLGEGAPDPGQEAALARIVALGAILHPMLRAGTLTERLAESRAIVEVGQVLTGLLALEDVLSYVIYLAESLVRGHSATIALLSPDEDRLVLRNGTGTLRDLEGRAISVENSVIGLVVRDGQPVVTPNVSDDPRGFGLAAGHGPGLVVPLRIRGGTIGAFLVTRPVDASPFTAEDLDTLQKIAAYATIAIQNARLYREQTDAAGTLRQQAAELQAAYSELARQQEQLIVSEKMAGLGRITAGIAHEINSPLGGIMNSIRTAMGYVEEYRSSVGDTEVGVEDHHAIAADILSSLELAEDAATRVAQFVRSIKAQTRTGDGQSTTFDPSGEVDSTVVLLQHRLRKENVGIFTRLEKGLSLTGDQGKFGVVMQNLITNAIDASPGGEGEIWVRTYSRNRRFHVEVEDRGTGIPEEIRGRIFDYLFTTKDIGKGTGLGLAIVHNIVTNEFGGEIGFDTEPGRGTTFRISIPLERPQE